jgi:hypothetical protein
VLAPLFRDSSGSRVLLISAVFMLIASFYNHLRSTLHHAKKEKFQSTGNTQKAEFKPLKISSSTLSVIRVS